MIPTLETDNLVSSIYETAKEENVAVLVCVMNKWINYVFQERRTHCELKINDQGSLIGTVES